MKKHLLLLFAFFFALLSAQAQQPPFSDNFDSYTAGQQLALQAGSPWTTFSQTPGSGEDPYISDEQSLTAPNSVKIIFGNDLVLLLGDKVTGSYKVSFSMYIPSGNKAYYNNLQLFDGDNSKWGQEVYFGKISGGNGCIETNTGEDITPFTYPEDEWFQVENYIDLDNNLAAVVINGIFILKWQWTLGASINSSNQLAALNIFPAHPDYEFYVDNVVYQEAPFIPISNWAIYLGIFFIGAFMFVVYRRRSVA